MSNVKLAPKLAEARVILPYASPEGVPLDWLHLELTQRLCAAWGGCTASTARGSWVDPDNGLISETVTTYDIAMEATTENAERLAAIAGWLARKGRQQLVYVRFACGTVELIPPAQDITAFTPAPVLSGRVATLADFPN